MYKHSLKHFIFLLIILAISAFTLKQDNEAKEKFLIKLVVDDINKFHFHPQDINDEFSKKVFKEYLKLLDFNKKFLIESDIKKLSKYETKLDDELKSSSLEFFDLSLDIITKRIDEAVIYYQEILSHPFDYTKDEMIETDGEKLNFEPNEAALKESWRKALKYQTILRLTEALEIQENAIAKHDTTIKIKTFEELEKDAREKVLKSNDEWFKSLKQFDRNDRFGLYVNAFTNVFDPHTEYFPPKNKEDFDIRMSGKFEGIGATLRQKDGYTTVENIVPGSASWRQGDLKTGDVILKVAQGADEPVDIVGMRLDKAVQLIRGKKGTEVRLTVKKIDGRIMVISIIRDVVILEETYAKSAVLKMKEQKLTIGYIKLPSFYVDFNDYNGRKCAKDVKLELEKLTEENVNGIILDLRENTGGSLSEVVEMGGYFIPKGPIVQVKQPKLPAELLLDTDPRVQYGGPLIILVNGNSASASEILAAAMQDYKRAVIIGTPTFGKGSVQRIYNLDEMNMSNSSNEFLPLGALKVTTQKFYRVNGGATQLKGVTPDIILPDFYSYMNIGEKELDNHLEWDEIQPATYEKVQNSSYNMNEIIQKSKMRTDKDSIFALVDDNAKRMKKLSDKTSFTLNLKEYREEQKKLKDESEKYKNISRTNSLLNIYTVKADSASTARDTIKLSRNENWFQLLKKDIYINEAAQVMKDMIK